MGQIDEVSAKLGGLEVKQDFILKTLNVIEGLAKDFTKQATLNEAAAAMANKRLDVIEPVVDEYETNRDEAKGAWKVLVGVAGGVSFIVSAVLGILPYIFR